MMANYDPNNYDVLFLLFGSDQSPDPSAFGGALRAALEPWYAFPFAPAVQMDAPAWVSSDVRDQGISVGTNYVARSGALSTPLPAMQGVPAGPYPFDTAFRFVIGVRWVLQQRSPATADVSRRTAKDTLRGNRTRGGVLMNFATGLGGQVVDFNIVPYASRGAYPLQALPFPSTPSLPGNEATYKSGAIFAVLAGIAVGGVLISAALKKD